jgi:hypothetical protein
MTVQENIAPVYKYFTADLLTNRILAEVPFRGVNYVRALRGAGTFTGSIPILDDTRYLNLYDTTTPGNTALYVVRDGICVWGGIIWARDYNIVDRVLNVSASEFTSYFYHRRVWKTWNHEYEATAVVEDGVAEIELRLGATTALQPGASVYLQFNDVSFDRYNNFYEVGVSQQPTTKSFVVDDITKKATITTLERVDGSVNIITAEEHKFGLNDLIVVDSEEFPELSGTHRITYVGGATGDKLSFILAGTDIPRTVTTGEISRTIQSGEYPGITVFVRSDTYDYIRGLVEGTFSDFLGIDFPNTYVEPGLRYNVEVTQRRLQNGVATIWTDTPHDLSAGKAVVVKDLGPNFDGEHVVSAVLSPTQFTYPAEGVFATSNIAPYSSEILSIEAVAGDTTITTVDPHNFLVGQTVDIRTELGFEGLGRCLNDKYVISNVLGARKFTYTKPSRIDVPRTTFARSFASVSGQERDVIRAQIANNVATLTTSSPHNYAVGQTATISGVTPIVEIAEKSYDRVNTRATIVTREPHNFQTGDNVVINGLRDASKIIDKTISGTGGTRTVKFTTELSHNFKTSDVVEISGLVDSHRVTTKVISSNVATLTTAENNNFPIGSEVTVSDIYDEYTTRTTPNSRSLQNNIATLFLSTAHNIKVNDSVTVSGLSDVGDVVSRALENKIATLTLNTAHNFFEGDEITVAGVGSPFNGRHKVSAVTRTRVQFELPRARATQFIAPARSAGTVTSKNSVFNGDFVVIQVTSNSISYNRQGNLVQPIAAPSGRVRTLSSAFNGIKTVTAKTANTFSYAVVANNSPSVTVPLPKKDSEIPPATASQESIHTGQRTLTAVERNTISFAQTGITNNLSKMNTSGYITAESVFNGSYSNITRVSEDTFSFIKTGIANNVLETAENSLAYVRAPGIYNGNRVITAIDKSNNTFSFSRTHVDVPGSLYVGFGSAIVTPLAISSTFGPYSGNSDIGIEFPTKGYSGYQVLPTTYRGFELANVGEILDEYSDNINGFEYRIDCFFDEEESRFTKVFVIVPINFPDAPEAGQASALERFGAERLIFEYPGNIRNMSLAESAENSSTRFFAVGENDLGPDAGPPISVATTNDFLNGESGRRWPLLDDSEEVKGVDDELILYAYAKRYLSEATPPIVEVNLEVNGALEPRIGTYNPGDWCSVVINDDFILSRLKTKLEPRSDIIVRKIESISVSVPDGVATPEVVDVVLIPEWEVDKRVSSGGTR